MKGIGERNEGTEKSRNLVGKSWEGRFVIDSRIKFGTSTFTYLYILLFTSVCLPFVAW